MRRSGGGQPLVVLAAVLFGWCSARAMSWEPPVTSAFAEENVAAGPQAKALTGTGQVLSGPQSPAFSGYAPAGTSDDMAVLALGTVYRELAEFVRNGGYREGGKAARLRPDVPDRFGDYVLGDFPGISAGTKSSDNGGAGVAFAAQPVPDSGVRSPSIRTENDVRPRRWSADAWAFLRSGTSSALANGQLPATYGASQAGAVLRYRLFRDSPRLPDIYLRTTSTLGMSQESSAAVGLAARPVVQLPMIASVELRVTDQAGQRRWQPAVMAVSELQPFTLPGGLRGEAYGQAGYVAGKFATPFADGSARADYGLFSSGPIEARIGAGAWAGFQKGASRIDIGPSATVTMPLGKATYGRLALDWRLRMAGDAEPDSGPSVTVSAGF